MGFQNANENVFYGFGILIVWLWKSFGNIFKGVRTYPVEGLNYLLLLSRPGEGYRKQYKSERRYLFCGSLLQNFRVLQEGCKKPLLLVVN